MRVKRGHLKSLYGVLVSVILALLLQTALVQTVHAAKVKVATALGRHPVFVMPMLAIEDNGLWKQVGVDAEWVSFRSGTSMNQAAAAGSIQLGVTDSTTVVRSIVRGLPALIVYYMGPIADWGIWVLTDSKIKKASDLKNKSITVTRLGSSPHAYSQLVAKAEGMAGAIKYVGTGGVREDVASLLSGAVDSSMLTIFVVAPLIDKGRVRRLLSVSDYLPKKWMGRVFYARTDFLKRDPNSARKVLKAINRGTKFVMNNRDWTIEKMKSFSKYNQKVAEFLYPRLKYNKEGRINKEGLANVRDFLIKFNIISEAKTPPVEKFYTDQFTR